MLRLPGVHGLRRTSQVLARGDICKSQGCTANLVRNYWNKEFAASKKIPETPAEREAAAKKYGMLPQDYKPYPNDGFGFGDYPQLPDKGVDSRDPWEDYDMPSLRRNFGDPVHLHADIYGEDRYQPDKEYFVSMPKMYMTLFGILGTYIGLYFFFEDYKTTTLVMEKQLPYQYKYTGGKKPVHYTFEFVEESQD